MNYRTKGFILIFLALLVGLLSGILFGLGYTDNIIWGISGIIILFLALIIGWRGCELLNKWNDLKTLLED